MIHTTFSSCVSLPRTRSKVHVSLQTGENVKFTSIMDSTNFQSFVNLWKSQDKFSTVMLLKIDTHYGIYRKHSFPRVPCLFLRKLLISSRVLCSCELFPLQHIFTTRSAWRVPSLCARSLSDKWVLNLHTKGLVPSSSMSRPWQSLLRQTKLITQYNLEFHVHIQSLELGRLQQGFADVTLLTTRNIFIEFNFL